MMNHQITFSARRTATTGFTSRTRTPVRRWHEARTPRPPLSKSLRFREARRRCSASASLSSRNIRSSTRERAPSPVSEPREVPAKGGRLACTVLWRRSSIAKMVSRASWMADARWIMTEGLLYRRCPLRTPCDGDGQI